MNIITIHIYYTPSGRLIQRPFDALDEYYLDSNSADTVVENQKQYFTKSGRVVYGGGGITPDIIQKNEIKYNESTRKIYYHEDRLLFKYAGEIKENRIMLPYNLNELMTNYEINQDNFFEWLDN